MTEDVPVYAAALLLGPSKRKSYIEECWSEEWHEGAFAAARSLWKEEYNHNVEIHLSEQFLAVPTLLKQKKDTMLSKMRLERTHGLAVWLLISCLYQQNQQSQNGPSQGLGAQLDGIGSDC
uniref:Uncharacterized protein n=1 Tax=Fusarium oxysporum (strain Fo5176) TaxID=660025 RepID=A0A0D2XT27_FUSOF